MSLLLDVLTLLAIIFAVYKYFRDPDVNANLEIALMKQKCAINHESIDRDILVIKENHLKHIEIDIKRLENAQTKILTILDERLPPKR